MLVATLGPKFSALVVNDKNSYAKFYPRTAEASFNRIDTLLETIAEGYDIVHLFCDVSQDGSVMDPEGGMMAGTALVDASCKLGVKLIWIAWANHPDGYLRGFKAPGIPINLLMTICRSHADFNVFLEEVLSRMSKGVSLVLAWAAVAPQGSKDPRPKEVSEFFVFAGRGTVILL